LVRPLLILGPLACLAVPLGALASRPPISRPAAAPVRAASSAFNTTLRPFLARHCDSCHNAKSSAAGVDLTAYKTAAALGKDPHVWEHVVQKMRSGEMPPKGSPRPSPESIKAVTAWIESALAQTEQAAGPNPGRVTARRLNRAEYNNTVRDLLGVDFHPADDFPQDDSGYGFDNIGDVLSLSPVLMEKYLNAAEKVARTAVFGPGKIAATLTKNHPGELPIKSSTKPETNYDLSGLSMPNAIHGIHRFPADGDYQIRIVLGGVRPRGSDPVQAAFWIDGKQVQTIDVDPYASASFSEEEQSFSGKGGEFRLHIPAGDHWIAASILHLYDGLPPRYEGPNPSKRIVPPPPAPMLPPNPSPSEIDAFNALKEKLAKKVPTAANQLRVRVMEFAGPYGAAAGPAPESLRKIYTCGHLHGEHQPACARKIVSDFAQRAFRRPVAPAEVDKYARLVSLARAQGDSFEEGVCLSLQAILVSPHFLFRIEQEPKTATATGDYPISQYELASRLSYFLWSSMPDAELTRCAASGTLRKPEVLAGQVRRMLKDPKSRALVENFGGQWLELRKLEAVKPDTARFPEWDEYLRLSMRQETEEFLAHLLREDGSLLDLVDADYSYLNERLARFYGIPGVKGPEFRKVSLAGTPRGGILTQASVLTVSSYSTRTSPVMRGRWVLENMLNAPPPPPPPGVPTLDETKVGEAASLRKQLEAHRVNPTCASCHSRMDPLGFGLENFDAIGGWRTVDGKFPIDASASLPDGRSFRGPGELKKVLKGDRDAFTQCVTEKLLTYGLGRGLERYDRSTVKGIAARVAKQDYRFPALVLEIVNSAPFQMRRGEQAK
jgi:mono/diheme cytochrome c family protein